SAPLDNGGHTASRWGPAVVVGAGFAGIPLAAYGTQVYPEIVAAGCVVTALLGLRSLTDQGRSGRPAAVIVVVAAVVALPWLAIKYTPVAAVVAVALLLGLAGHPRVADRVEPNRRKTVIAAATVTVTLTVAGVVYLVAHRWIYGGWTAYASGDHFVDSGEFAVIGNEFSLLGRSRRLIGLLIDNTFGIAVWQPLWFLLVPAVVDGVRRRRWLLLALLGTGWLTATYVALTMHGWWVPGRQLVVVLPAALVLIAVWADRPGRIVATALLGLAGLVNWLWLALETTTGRRTLVVDFDQTAAIPYRLVGGITPDGMRAAPGDDLALVVWAVVLIATALLIRGRTVGSQDGDSDTEPTPTLPDPRRNELPTP
ncbi:MAG: hypothetical protein OER95_16605, partial [Acidimicrobiia bacterium]|nr:hypothetical protein [Acidimicrobiia bacterium]